MINFGHILNMHDINDKDPASFNRKISNPKGGFLLIKIVNIWRNE